MKLQLWVPDPLDLTLFDEEMEPCPEPVPEWLDQIYQKGVRLGLVPGSSWFLVDSNSQMILATGDVSDIEEMELPWTLETFGGYSVPDWARDTRHCWCPCSCGWDTEATTLEENGLCYDCHRGNHEVPPAGVTVGVESLLEKHQEIVKQYQRVLSERAGEEK